MRSLLALLALALANPSAAAQVLGSEAKEEAPEPTVFDERWLAVRPRKAEGIYPNLPPDWQPIANPRYEVPSDRPLAGLRICIDAGHGGQVWGSAHGYTGGTRGAESGLTESEANLRTALFLWDLLTQAGAEVVMTRTRPDRMTAPGTSARVELHERVAIAETEHCDHFLSIHHNAPGGNQDPQTNYTSVHYFDTSEYDEEYNRDPVYVRRHPDPELNTERSELALAIQNALVRRLDLPPVKLPEDWPQHFDRGVPHGDFHVIREISVPAVLVECSFMTNPEEDRRLNDPGRAKQEALAIFEGILDHFESRPIRPWIGRGRSGPAIP